MSEAIGSEEKFLREVGDYEFIARDMQAGMAALDTWLASLLSALEARRAKVDGLKRGSELASQVDAIEAQLLASMHAWSRQWAEHEPVRRLMASLGDQAILLVFGKVNAGKSSFCNFLAERFAENGKSTQYFYIEAGEVIDTQEPFQEKETEATSRIQGVRLDGRLIILDTPGLHSVTRENGELTRRFSDSADGVLWLTSSTSPGQVQELDALCRELQSSKPLLPVITRSDEFIEDEVDDAIVKVLRNKTAKNRAEQEGDVNERAAAKLRASQIDVALLRSPVSVSVWAADRDGQTPAAMEAAGFERLYLALLALIQPALVYKRRKAAEAMLHHLEENVLEALRLQVLPRTEAFQQASQSALDALESLAPRMASASGRAVIARLPELLERHKAARDVQAVCRDLSALMFEELGREMDRSLKDYVVAMDDSLAQLSPDGRLAFEDRTVEVEVKKGAARRAAAGAVGAGTGAWVGAEAGALLGSLVPVVGTAAGGVVGGIVGGLIGGLVGGKGGEVFEGTDIERKVVGVSYERLHAALEAEVRRTLPRLASHAVAQCKKVIEQMMADVARMDDIIRTHERGLEELKEKLRNESI